MFPAAVRAAGLMFLVAAPYLLLAHASKGDVLAFAFWTVPFAGFVGVLGHILGRGSTGKLRTVFINMCVGLLVGYFYALGVSLLLHGWLQAFSFPAVLVWMACAGAHLAYATGPWALRTIRPFRRFAPLLLMTVVLVAILTGTGFLIRRVVLKECQLILVFAEYMGDGRPLHFADRSMTAEESRALAGLFSDVNSDILGELKLVNCMVEGRGPRSVALIIFPPEFLAHNTARFQLQLPYGATVIHQFQGGKWVQTPPDAPTNGREIILYREPGGMVYEFQDNYGDFTGGPIEAPSPALRRCPDLTPKK